MPLVSIGDIIKNMNKNRRKLNRKKLTVEDIRSQFPKEKKNFEKYNLWVRPIIRPSSYYLTWLFLRLGISANNISYFSLIIGTIGCILLAFNTYKGMIIGALLINFYDLLDSVDGNMARCTNTCSKYGALLDNVVDTTMSVLLFSCAGIGVFNHSEQWINLSSVFILTNIDKSVFLFLGCWSSLGYIFPRLLGCLFQKLFSENRFIGREDVLGAPSSFFNVLTVNFYNITGLVLPMLLLAVIFRLLGLFVILFALINTSAFIISVLLLIRKARRI